MPHPGFQRVSAALKQAADAWGALDAAPAGGDETEAEALRLAELDAAFALLGLKTAHARPERAGPDTADDYLADFGLTLTAINDAPAPHPRPKPRPARFVFPLLARRGLHIAPGAAIKLIPIVDWAMLLLAAECAARWGAGVGLAGLNIGAAASFLLAALGLKAGLWLTGIYRTTPARIKPENGIGGLALGAIFGLAVAAVLAPDARGAAALAAILPAAAFLLAGMHAALAVWIRAAHRAGVFAENIVIVGANEAAARFAARAAETGEARILAVIDDRLARAPSCVGQAPVGGDIDALLAWDGLPYIDRIVIAVTQKAEARVRGLIERLRVAPNRIDLLLDYETTSVRARGVDRLMGLGLACVSGRPRNLAWAAIKRAQDLVLGAGLAVLFAPLLLVIAAAVRLDAKGPVLYRQRRHGFNNRVITILKFRTLRHDAAKDDARVTRLGRLLRRTGFDELPQLFNVLRGEMSLVGPRPHAIGVRAGESELSHIVAEYAHRHRVKPGITGWAQINGARGQLETQAGVRERVRLDLDYVSRASLWLDLQILIRTAAGMLGGRTRPS